MSWRLLSIIGCFLLSILLILILFSMSHKINHGGNWGFIRLVPPKKIFTGKLLDIKYDSYYICGLTSTNIYLGSYSAPGHVLVCNYNLSDTHSIKLSVPLDKTITLAGVTVSIDSPNVY